MCIVKDTYHVQQTYTSSTMSQHHVSALWCRDKNASSRVAKAFTDIIVIENNQHNQIRMILYLMEVRVVLYAVTSLSMNGAFGFPAPKCTQDCSQLS